MDLFASLLCGFGQRLKTSSPRRFCGARCRKMNFLSCCYSSVSPCMIAVRGVCVRITGAKSSVYWSRCMYSTKACFCLLSCSWSLQRLSQGKDVFQFFAHGVCVCVLLYHCILGLVYNSFLDSSHNPVPQLMMSLPVDHSYTACTVCVFVLFAVMTKACLVYYAIHLFFHKGCAGLPFLQPEKHYPRWSKRRKAS